MEAVDAEVAASHRRAEALTLAAGAAHDDLVAAVRKHAGEVREQVDGQVADRARVLVEQVEAMAAAHDELGLALATRSWLDGFPGRPFQPGGQLSRLTGLRGVNGEDYHWAHALEAIRDLARRAAPDEEKAA